MLRIVPAHPNHIGLLAPKLRLGDRSELAALGATAEDALCSALRASSAAWFAHDDGEPLAMYGFEVDFLLGGNRAGLWCLTGNEIAKYKKRFLLESRAFVDTIQTQYPLVTALVAKGYTGAVSWVTRWLNFTVVSEIDINGTPFLSVRRERTWASKH